MSMPKLSVTCFVLETLRQAIIITRLTYCEERTIIILQSIYSMENILKYLY